MTGFHVPHSPHRILSTHQVRQVHEYALQLLETCGCSVQCQEALDILGHAGADVRNPARVTIPRRLVMDALDSAPKRIDVYDRTGQLAMTLDQDCCYYGTGSDCPRTIDLYSGERRGTTKADIGNLARVCDALPNIDFVMTFGIAQEEHAGNDFVYGYEALLTNTTKPAIVTAHGRNDMQTMIAMAAASCAGIAALREKPSLVLYTEPLSPLVHTEMGVRKGLVCCENNIPFIYIGSPMMGASAPATVEGILVQAVAECLSGLVIFQQKKPGAKFIFGADATVMDMTTMIFSYGAPELQTLNGALADMAHHYRLPFFCIAGASDAKIVDAQAGLEYALSLYNATLNGCNIIHDCGYLESGLTSSFESVLLADEIISMLKHMLKPLKFDRNSVPLQVMGEVGPGGTFLKTRHTRAHFKEAFWFPHLLDRNVFERWMEAGQHDLRDVLNQKARQIFEQHQPVALPENVLQSIRTALLRHTPDV